MAKVLENTGTRLLIESDNSAYRLLFSKRYDVGKTETGRDRYVFLGWMVKAYTYAWAQWKTCSCSHIPQNYANKQTVIDFIGTRPAFSQAYKELTARKSR